MDSINFQSQNYRVWKIYHAFHVFGCNYQVFIRKKRKKKNIDGKKKKEKNVNGLKNSFPTLLHLAETISPRIKCLYFRARRISCPSFFRCIRWTSRISMLFITIRFDEQIFKRSRNRKIIYFAAVKL